MNNSDRMMFQQKSSLSAVFEKRSEMAETVFKFLGNFHCLSSLKMFFCCIFFLTSILRKVLVYENFSLRSMNQKYHNQ